jgi:hypothetical protein
MGNTPVVGTAGAEPTPRLLISIEPNGIPVRAPPPGVVGNVDVGVDDEATLLEPEPHIPDIPDVSSIPEDVDIPGAIDICDNVDVPGVAVGSAALVVAAIAVLPVVAAVAGVAAPAAVPPPSKLAVDPYIPEYEVPTVEHVVLVIAPPVGIAIVPVTPPVGAGLTPSEVISVESSGIPVPPTDPLAPIPSGVVTPSEGVAVSGSSTWANAALHPKADSKSATITDSLIVSFQTQWRGGSGGDPVGRRHELRSHRILDRLFEDVIDLRHRGVVDMPSHDVIDRRQLLGPPGAP